MLIVKHIANKKIVLKHQIGTIFFLLFLLLVSTNLHSI